MKIVIKKSLIVIVLCFLIANSISYSFAYQNNFDDIVETTSIYDMPVISEIRTIEIPENLVNIISENSDNTEIYTEIEGFVPSNLEIENYEEQVTPAAVINGDQRSPVSEASRSRFPYTAIGYVTSNWSDGTATRGTGALIGDNVVLTAGHNIYDVVEDRFATSITFTPGRWSRTGTGAAPYGSSRATDYYHQEYSENITTTMTVEQRAQIDWGILVLEDNLGNDVGAMGVRWYHDANYVNGLGVRISGYPKCINEDETTVIYEQYESAGNISGSWEDYVTYLIDTSKGQSGAPVFEPDNHILAIHNYGIRNNTNFGKRVDELVLYWCQFIIDNY